jgi:hypothetical protein
MRAATATANQAGYPLQRWAPPTLRYDIYITVDLPKHTLTGTLDTTYQNQTGHPLPTLTFYVPLGTTKNAFFLTALSADPPAVRYTQAMDRLDVDLDRPLPPGCSIRVRIGFRVNVFPIPEGAAGSFGYFGYSDRQTNLSDWLPTVAPYRDSKPLIPREWPVGETRVTDAATYHAEVTVTGAANPTRLDVAGPGEMKHPDTQRWTFDLDRGRNFALSFSESFIKDSTITADGLIIDLYHFQTSTPSTAPRHALETARDAGTVFTRVFGTLPLKRISVVQADFPDGMEFSGIVFVSTRWFTALWEGKPDSWLTVITAHEVAHQWWYSSVGDDQGQTPWLDESFAIYSELLFIEDKYPDLATWWWKWRVEQYKPTGYVDSSVYDFAQVRPYINAVYLRGALMLQEIRESLGSPAFIRWLRAYAATEADQIADPADVWGLLASDDYLKIAPIRARYLTSPDPLGRDPATPATAPNTSATQAATHVTVTHTAQPTAAVRPGTKTATLGAAQTR